MPKSRITPDSATAGAPGRDARVGRGSSRRLSPAIRSLAGRLILIFIILVSVPIIIYAQFLEADQEKQTLLLRSVQEQGRLIGQALLPLLTQADGVPRIEDLRDDLERLAAEGATVRILFRPADSTGQTGGFFFFAAEPPIPTDSVAAERDRLVTQGVFEFLLESCSGETPLALRHETPTGGEEILTSITPVNTDQGCWAVITSQSTTALVGEAIAQPYWKRADTRVAAAIYGAMVVITLMIFITVWRSVARFGRLAREIGREGKAGSRFADLNRVPELAGVAEDFDRLVSTLQESARSIRRTAEENAHALKTPIAIIRQSLEPLKRSTDPEALRQQRALTMIERSVDRLDALVSSARRMDEAAADLMTPPSQEVDLSDLVRHVLSSYDESLAARHVTLAAAIENGIRVVGGPDLLETVFENLLDNALSFSVPGSALDVRLVRDGAAARLAVADEGPGVPPANMDRIFERYFSHRPETPGDEDSPDPDDDGHIGIGLWVVHRNVIAIGGRITAENREQGGLRMTVILPIAS